MQLNTHMHQRMDQRQILAPRMIQSMEILQLPIMALQERIQQELQENPVLELTAYSEENATEVEGFDASTTTEEVDPGNQELIIDTRGDSEDDFDRLEALNRDWENHFNEEHRPSRNGLDEESDKKHDAMQNMASRPQSLQEYLNDQLSFLDLNEDQLDLVKYLITHIDDNGYLTASLEEIAQGFEEVIEVEELEDALLAVQKLDPPGVGARDLAECLLLQLTPETPHRDVLRVLIQNHLDDIRHNRLPNIQKRTGLELPGIKEAIESLRHLNPQPGAQFRGANIT